MNFSQPVLSDEHLPHQVGHQSRSSSSSSTTAVQQGQPRRQPSLVVTSPAGDMDAQFEQLLSLIGTDRSPIREQEEGKGLEAVGGGSARPREPLSEGRTVNGKIIQGLGVGHPTQPPSSNLSPTRPALGRPTRLGSYSSVPIASSATFDQSGVPPPRRPHSVASGERPTETQNIFSSGSAATLLPLPVIPSQPSVHELHPADVVRQQQQQHQQQQQSLRPQPHVHTRNASASSSNSASSSSYRRQALAHAEMTLEHDPFSSQPTPKQAAASVGVEAADDFSSDGDSTDSDDDQLESLPPSSAHHLRPHEHPYHHQYHTHPPSPHPPTPQRQPHQEHQRQPSLPTPTPPNYFAAPPAPPQPQLHATHQHLPPRRPENFFQPPLLPPTGPDYNRDERPLVPPAYPQPGAVKARTTSRTMEIAQSEGWAVDGQDDDVDASRDSGPASERGDGNDDQREFLTRPLGLLALSQALSAANDEVAGLRSMVRDVTHLVHAQGQDAFARAQYPHHHGSDKKASSKDSRGPSGLTDAEIDELSGSEAREYLKSMAQPPLPPPTQITSSLALIRHIHDLAGCSSRSNPPDSEDDQLVFSDANLMRLADVIKGWKAR